MGTTAMALPFYIPQHAYGQDLTLSTCCHPHPNCQFSTEQTNMYISSTNFYKSIQTDTNSSIELPTYQSRQNRMLNILHEYETFPLHLVSGFIRELGIESLIPQDLTHLCFKFYQHCEMAKVLDSKN